MSDDPEAVMTSTQMEQEPLLFVQQQSSSISASSVDDTTTTTDKQESLWHDAKDTLLLGIPIFLSMLSWVGMKTTDSALLGHVSADALSAAALSDLVRSFSVCW